MSEYTKKFITACKEKLNLDEGVSYEYNSLSICIIDCVYSLRTKYTTTTEIVQRYADKYLNGNTKADNETISDMVSHFEELNELSDFSEIVANHQVLGGKASIPKENVCYTIAKYLKYLHIETMNDFMNFPELELLEAVIKSVKGMGDAGTNYLFMLAGDPKRCKPDVHVNRFIESACGEILNNGECQNLFTEAVEELKKDFPALTVRKLDGVIWRYSSSNK